MHTDMNPWFDPFPERYWEQDGFSATLLPHPLNTARALMDIVIGDLDDEAAEHEPAAIARSLHQLLRINGDLLLPTGWAVVMDDEEQLLLRAEIDLTTLEGPQELEQWMAQGMELAASVRLVWLTGLMAGTQTPAP